jgi:hypothetical protein
MLSASLPSLWCTLVAVVTFSVAQLFLFARHLLFAFFYTGGCVKPPSRPMHGLCRQSSVVCSQLFEESPFIPQVRFPQSHQSVAFRVEAYGYKVVNVLDLSSGCRPCSSVVGDIQAASPRMDASYYAPINQTFLALLPPPRTAAVFFRLLCQRS